ncbi:MAG: histone deacetylase family protein [Halodesulfurarchaeum sp.]
MKFGFNGRCLDHDPGTRHPENPDRLRAIREGLEEYDDVEYENAEPATRADAVGVHEDSYVDEIREFSLSGGGNWDPDTVATESTWDAALASAGIAKWTVDYALDAELGPDTPFSLGRPPGHHATPADAMGFCFLNNVAIAAHHARTDHGVDRIAILDWDVHHGNGTQEIFYQDEDVFYLSLHEQGLFPGTGDIDDRGEGEGEGTTLNVPLPPGSGDVDYLTVFDRIVTPSLQSFAPTLILVSAGFDAHRHDPISRMHVTTEGYGLLADRVRELAAGLDAGLGFVLEGGYGLDTLAAGVGVVHEVFGGRTIPEIDGSVQPDVEALMENLQTVHQGAGSK